MDADTRAIERAAAHRPWPMPSTPWAMFQSWRDLLFAHWPVPVQEIEGRVPAGLRIDLHDGRAWLGLAPFRVVGLRPRCFPAVRRFSDFHEVNLRTYVRVGDRGGVFFFTLDATSRLAVAAARTAYRLPYRLARVEVEKREGWVHYHSRRPDGSAELAARYRPVGPVFHAEPGTLEHFLTERYALYTGLADGRILRADIHHRPWALQATEAVFDRNEMAAAHDLVHGGPEPILHFAARQDTLVWLPEVVAV